MCIRDRCRHLSLTTRGLTGGMFSYSLDDRKRMISNGFSAARDFYQDITGIDLDHIDSSDEDQVPSLRIVRSKGGHIYYADVHGNNTYDETRTSRHGQDESNSVSVITNNLRDKSPYSRHNSSKHHQSTHSPKRHQSTRNSSRHSSTHRESLPNQSSSDSYNTSVGKGILRKRSNKKRSKHITFSDSSDKIPSEIVIELTPHLKEKLLEFDTVYPELLSPRSEIDANDSRISRNPSFVEKDKIKVRKGRRFDDVNERQDQY